MIIQTTQDLVDSIARAVTQKAQPVGIFGPAIAAYLSGEEPLPGQPRGFIRNIKRDQRVVGDSAVETIAFDVEYL